MEQNKINILLNYCLKRPYIFAKNEIIKINFRDSINSVIAEEIAKEAPAHFFMNDVAIYSKIFLRDFWEKELEIQLLEKEKIKVDDFISQAKINFSNMYDIEHPTFKPKDLGYPKIFDDETGEETLEYELEYGGIFSFLGKIGFSFTGYDIIDGEDILQPKTLIKITKKYSIADRMIFHLLRLKDRKLKISLLTHKLNTDDVVFEQAKPFNIIDIKKEAELKNGYFNILEESNETVIALTNFLYDYKKHLEKYRHSYDRMQKIPWKPGDKSGVLVVGVSDKEFPLFETREYLKIRNYLKIDPVADRKNWIDNFFDISNLKNPNSVLHNLCAVYYGTEKFESISNENIEKFITYLKENLFFSNLSMEFNRAEEFATYLKIELAPLFNLEPYTGNLFSKVINQKFDSFNQIIGKFKLDSL